MGWLQRLLPIIRPLWLPLAAATAASTVGGLAASAGPLVEKVIVDDVIVAGTRPLVPWLGLLLLVGFLTLLTTMLRRYWGSKFSVGVQHELRVATYDQAVHLDAEARDALRAGDVFSRGTADVSLLNAVLGRVHNQVGNLVRVVTSIVAMAILSPLLAAIVAVCIPAFVVTSRRMRSRLFPAVWHSQRALAGVTTKVAETVRGVRVVRAFGQSGRESGDYTSSSSDLFRSRLRVLRLSSFYGATLEALPGLGQVLVVVAGGVLAIRGQVTLGTFVAFSSYVSQLLGPIRSISRYYSNSQQARAGAERIFSFLDIPRAVDDGTLPVDRSVRGSIAIRDVAFGYGEGRDLFSGLSLEVEAGERVAVVGLSGSGKSTLAQLLVRLYDPDKGAIVIDGHDIRDYRLVDLRRLVGGVVAEPFLFSASVRENITFGMPSATDDEVAEAAVVAGAAELIEALPDGYDTVIGERGMTLSGGQRQRIALARAVLGDRRILLLDDATSAVDGRTEQAIYGGLERVMGARTTVLFAQRRSTLRLADRIVVLDEGRVAAEGTLDELLEHSLVFRAVWGDETLDEAVDDPRRKEGLLRRVNETIGVPTRNLTVGAVKGARRVSRDARRAGMAVETPELLEAVDRLPALSGKPDVGVASNDDSGPFSVRSLIRPFRRQLLGGLALVTVSAVLALISPLLVREAIDSGIIAGSENVLFALGVVMLLVVTGSWYVTNGTGMQTGRTAERILFVVRVRTFRKFLSLPMAYFDQQRTGRVIARLTADVEALGALLQTGLITTAVSTVTAVGAFLLLFWFDWRLGVGVASVLIPMLGLTLIFRSRARAAHSDARESLSSVYAELAEGIDAATSIQLEVAQEAMSARFAGTSRHYMQARLRNIRLTSAYFPAIRFLAEVAMVMVLGMGAVMVEDGTITVGLLLAFLLYVDYFFNPMQSLSEQIDLWTAARVAVHKIAALMAEKPEQPSDTESAASPPPDEMSLDHVSFAYPSAPSRRVMEDISVDLRAGETLAVVGATGAGKSTLAKLLMGFYQPTSGTVRVGGVPLAYVDLDSHRRRIGYVPQEPVLFSASVRDNIAYGRPEASDAEVEEAARLVGIDETVRRLPDGYETLLGQTAMSAGERQLICLARALLVDPDLLILDEATANLDLAAETRVQAAMDRVAKARTTVVIAHRLQTVTSADRVIVLDQGVLVEEGSHEELLAAAGLYSSMWSAFAS